LKKGCLITLSTIVGIILIIFLYNEIKQSQEQKELKRQEEQRLEIEKKNREFRLSNTPQTQMEFETERDTYYKKYKEAKNDILKSRIYKETNEYSSRFAVRNNFVVKNWYGTVTNIYSHHEGKFLSFEVKSKLRDIIIAYSTLIKYTSDTKNLFDQISVLAEGDKVLFHFEFAPDAERGIKETSFSESGSLREPEFKGLFHNVKKLK
jgi:hypothetical protein